MASSLRAFLRIISCFSGSPKFVRDFRRLLSPHHNSPVPETPKAGLWGAKGRRVSPGHFRVVGCRAFGLDLEEGLGDEPEELALFLPVMRQIFAQPQEPGRCQRDGMLSRKMSTNDAGSEIGEA